MSPLTITKDAAPLITQLDIGQASEVKAPETIANSDAIERQKTDIRFQIATLRERMPSRATIEQFAKEMEVSIGDYALLIQQQYPELFAELSNMLDANNPIEPQDSLLSTLEQNQQWHAIVEVLQEELLPQRDMLATQIQLDLDLQGADSTQSTQIATTVTQDLIGTLLIKHTEDAKAMFNRDPAADAKVGPAEIRAAYPGPKALLYHRVAHELHSRGSVVVSRMIAEIAHEKWGIDIHPAATFGRKAAIDHGTGFVAGSSVQTGDEFTGFHNVTLGAAVPVAKAHLFRDTDTGPRHPQLLGDRITVYSGAKLYGGQTVVQSDVVIGADATAFESSIGKQARVGIGSLLYQANIGIKSRVHPQAIVSHSQIGDMTTVGQHSTVMYADAGSSVDIGPNTVVAGSEHEKKQIHDNTSIAPHTATNGSDSPAT